MQTIQLQVKDDYVKNVMGVLESVKDVMIEKINIQKDPNLEYDSYFYERREQLHKLRDDIRSGKMKMIPHNEFWDEGWRNYTQFESVQYFN